MIRTRVLLLVSTLTLSMSAAWCLAQTVYTSDSTIGDTDFSVDGQNIVIRGCTVTINGAHTFHSIVVERNASNQPGVLTHGAAFSNASVQGVALTVTQNVTIEGANANLVASRIDVSAKGHAPATGPGAGQSSAQDGAGAGHAGAGGDSSLSAGGGTYGAVFAPVDFGSGGGNAGGLSNGGGRGGGALRLIVGGALTVNGLITADGEGFTTSVNGFRGGGGSGGSVWITASSFAGTGSISSLGGRRFCCSAGGGGGGRVVVEYAARSFSGSVVAGGGDGLVDGGAGTVFLKPSSGRGTLILDNGVQAGESTEMSGDLSLDAHLIVRGGAVLGPVHQDPTLHLSISGDVTVESTGAIAADFRGYPSGSGPTAGADSLQDSAGGGHGGAGGDSNLGAGGGTGDSFLIPVEMGSGGGHSGGVDNGGGRGGGAFSLSCGGTLTVEGRVSANGESGVTASNGYRGGGGAGGSIRLSCTSFAGSGVISAHGGSRFCCSAGGGGGGCITVAYTSKTFTGVIGAFGGDGLMDGGAGTVFLMPVGARATLVIDNNGTIGESTELSGDVNVDANLVVRGGAVLGPTHQDPTLSLTFAGDVTVEAGASIGADARGFPSGSGPQAGEASPLDSGGAGHGGAGGDSIVSFGGGTYGSITEPHDMGSGGGNAGGVDNGGGRGGGAFALTCGGLLTVNGAISADGEGHTLATNGYRGGGGAGGSIRVSCGALAGAGTISAHGGNRYCCNAGGGGGGRIAVTYGSRTFSGIVGAFGGGGQVNGGAGTVFMKPFSGRGTLILDNNGVSGETTEMTGEVALDANLIVRGNAILGPDYQDPTMMLSLGGDATIEATGVISANGRGYPSGQGPGAGGNSTLDSAGGGYGGAGGKSGNGLLGGQPYGDEANPVLMGSGGGLAGGSLPANNAGGGVVRMEVAGTVTVLGQITSNGTAGLAANDYRGGGGSGGSIFIRAGALAGTGTITASGGNRYCCNAGGGGGGRVGIFSCNVLMSPALITAPAGDGQTDGQAGSVYFGASSINIFLQPDSATYVGGDEISLIVDAIGDGDLSFQWRREGVPVVDNDRITGSQSQQLTLSPIDCADGGLYDCVVTDACGTFPTFPAMITVVAPSDYDHSGFVDTDDYTAFVIDFELGIDAADFDHSGFVDTDDFTAFVLAFEAGC